MGGHTITIKANDMVELMNKFFQCVDYTKEGISIQEYHLQLDSFTIMTKNKSGK